MKGQIVMRFEVPTQGLILNQPKHKVGPDALVDGQNVFVDLDGLLKTRKGLLPVGSQLSPAERVMGFGYYEDNTGNFYPTLGTPTRWQVLQSGVWTDVSGGSLLEGTANDPVRFTNFASGGVNYIIGCNNNDVLHVWNSGASTYSAISASPVAKDVLTLANRVVTFNTVESDTRYNFRTRWSAINDHTTWPTLAFADLIDSGCSLVGAVLTSRLSCVIYRQFAGWYMQAVQGSDANAFAFDRIPAGDHMTGPVSPASIVIAEGMHFYFGTDGRIYMFNGSSIQPISDPVDPLLRGLYNNTTQARFSSCYVPAYRQLVFAFASFDGSSNVNAAIVFDLRRQAFEPLWTFPVNITAMSEMREGLGSTPTWLNWVTPTATWLTIPYSTWQDVPSGGGVNNYLSAYAGDDQGNVYRVGVGNQDNGTPIPYSATWGLLRSQDELQSSLVHYVEFYQTQSVSDDVITATILGYLQPYSVSGQIQSITSMTLQTDDQTTFYKTLAPGPHNANNLKSNLLQLQLNAPGSFGQFSFAGCTLLLDVDFRGDPRQGVGQ